MSAFFTPEDLVAIEQAATVYINALLKNMGRVDSSQRLMVNVDSGGLQTLGTVTTLSTLTNMTNMNNMSGGNTNHIPMNSAQMSCFHIYNNIIVT